MAKIVCSVRSRKSSMSTPPWYAAAETSCAAEGGGEGELVDGASPVVQVVHRLVEDPVGSLVEIPRAQDLHHAVHQVVVQQERRKDGLLRVEVVGRNPEGGVVAARR